VRAVLGRHVVRHKLPILLQATLRSPGHYPPEPQPSAGGGRFETALAFGFLVAPRERFM
jgi:hypothetical protein